MLQIKNLNKSFGKKRILKNFSHTFDERGICVIKGASGVGKTTLIRIIAGLDKEFSGSIIGGGIENTSFCFQEYRLFDALTALDNITKISFKNASESDVKSSEQLLKRLGFTDDELKFFPRELSGGMKQRVAFARAVMKNSRILILDEPTKEVDGRIREEMKKIIEECAQDRLVIMVTHNDDDIDGIEAKTIYL